MKNKGLIIALIVLLVIIIMLLIAFLSACIGGGMNFKNGIISFGGISNKVVFDRQFEMESVNDISITQNAGDIIFKKTTNDYIQVVLYGEDENGFNVSLNDSKLVIDYTNKNKFVLFNFGVVKNNIIVYIPENYYNAIKIKNNYGNVEMENLEYASVDIDSDYGNVELAKIKNATIRCDYGNIEINEVLNKCEIKADCGNVEIEKISIQENSNIKVDLGNVDINEINDVYVESDVDLGKNEINKNNRNSEVILKIKADCGNVAVGE